MDRPRLLSSWTWARLGRASRFNTRRHIARLARGLADISCARNLALPGRLGTFHVWFNANGTLHECGCACAGAWVKACAVGACGWVASFRLSFVVQLYVTAPSQVNAAFFARWVPLAVATHVATTFIPRQRAEASGAASGDDMAVVRLARNVFARAGRARHSTLGARSPSLRQCPSPPLSSPTAICPKWTWAGPRVFAAQLARVRQASLKSTSPMPCQCAMGPGQQAGREMWHAVLVRPAENRGVLSCVLEAL